MKTLFYWLLVTGYWSLETAHRGLSLRDAQSMVGIANLAAWSSLNGSRSCCSGRNSNRRRRHLPRWSRRWKRCVPSGPNRTVGIRCLLRYCGSTEVTRRFPGTFGTGIRKSAPKAAKAPPFLRWPARWKTSGSSRCPWARLCERLWMISAAG